MKDYFCSPHFLWFIVIPAGFLLNFVTWYNVNWLPIAYMSYLGVVAHYLGTNYPMLMLLSNILAWLAHMGEAFYAKTVCRRLKLSPRCASMWYAQTLLLGYPSLRLLLKYVKQSE